MGLKLGAEIGISQIRSAIKDLASRRPPQTRLSVQIILRTPHVRLEAPLNDETKQFYQQSRVLFSKMSTKFAIFPYTTMIRTSDSEEPSQFHNSPPI